jgi:hypothetical protein
MVGDRNDSTHVIDEPGLNLPPPRFDEKATANAQPVQPIPAGRVSTWLENVSSLRRGIIGRGKALVLVVIAGLVTGTLGGMTLVKEQVTDVSPAASESVSGLAPVDSQNEEPRAEVFGVTDLQSLGPTGTRIRKSHSRARSSRAPRAYRVAVLR